MSTWTVPEYAEGWAVPGYAVERELGQGTSGRVVAAVDDETGQRVAIKYLSPAMVSNQGFLRRFRVEAQQLRGLDVPQAVRLLDYIEQPGQGAAIVTELVDGVSLREILARQGPAGPEAAVAVLKGGLLGLGAAHRLGFGHRDYQPGNVLVDTAGRVRLTDFGVAVRAARQLLSPGTPQYLAPERWDGAPPGPATDIYAATAVFFECLTGMAPFSGDLTELEEQHWNAAPPADRVDAPLRRLIARGMAKDPAGRPQSAIAFVAQLEAQAGHAYGPDWEDRGRRQLAERVAALRPPLRRGGRGHARRGGAGPAGRPPRTAPVGRRRRGLAVAAAATAAVVVLGGAATAVTLRANGHQAGTGGSSSQAVSAVAPSFTAVANVTPPVAASKCATPVSFRYSGTLSASAPGTVRYQWVYSSGQPGPVRTVTFAAAGHKTVAGDTVSIGAGGGGWARIKVVSPAGQASGKAAYRLLCGSSAGTGGITALAAVQPAARIASCLTAPPAFTATGSVTATRAGRVTYYWARSDGHDSAPATVTFTGPGTKPTAPLTIVAPRASGSGEAVLVVTSPVAAASRPATYTLTCAAPKTAGPPGQAAGPSASAPVSRAAGSASPSTTATSTTGSSTPTAGQLALTVRFPAGRVNQSYSGTVTVSGGTAPYTWTPVAQLPAGVTAAADGATLTFTGSSLQEAGDFPLQLSVHDSSAPHRTASQRVTLSISALDALSLIGNVPGTGTVGDEFEATLTPRGGNSSYVWQSVAGLPPGVTANESVGGVTILGKPTRAGSYTLTVTLHDTEKTPETLTQTYPINVGLQDWAVIGPPLTGGEVGTPYPATAFLASNGVTVTWSASGLPPGLSIDPATGILSGTPTVTGSYSIVVTATETTTGAAKTYGPAGISIDPPAPVPSGT